MDAMAHRTPLDNLSCESACDLSVGDSSFISRRCIVSFIDSQVKPKEERSEGL